MSLFLNYTLVYVWSVYSENDMHSHRNALALCMSEPQRHTHTHTLLKQEFVRRQKTDCSASERNQMLHLHTLKNPHRTVCQSACSLMLSGFEQVCVCVRVYVVYEDINLFNNMGMTEVLQFGGGLWGHCLCPRNSKGLKNILNGVFLKI